jgi:flagellar biosynthesis/type III secretory pathway protein FliH
MKTAYEYMIALTADERTPSVKAMVDIILLDAAKAIDEALETDPDDVDVRISDSYDEGYSDGKNTGYEDGYSVGRSEGYDEGYEDAKAEFSTSDDIEDQIEKGVEGLA